MCLTFFLANRVGEGVEAVFVDEPDCFLARCPVTGSLLSVEPAVINQWVMPETTDPHSGFQILRIGLCHQAELILRVACDPLFVLASVVTPGAVANCGASWLGVRLVARLGSLWA